MRERMLSVIGGQASDYVNTDKPSELLPFRGEFPLLENFEVQDYMEAIQDNERLEDISERFQRITILGSRMYTLDKGFRDYLSRNNITTDAFLKKSKEDKADWLAAWLNADCVDFNSLTIR